MKKCSKCAEVKSFEEFYRNKAYKDGFKCYCKSCEKAYEEANKDKRRAYREANKDKRRAYMKNWHEANKDKDRAYMKNWYEANKDKAKAYYEANKDKIKAKKKAYREANKDKIKSYMKTYNEENKDKRRVYHKANKDKRRACYEAKKSERIEQLKQIIEPNTDNEWIYIMQCGIYHKIGISNDPLRRCEQIERETKAPTDIIYLAKAFSGRTKDCEKIIHHELGCFNVPMPYAGSDATSREWFYGSLDKMVEVVSLYADVEEI